MSHALKDYISSCHPARLNEGVSNELAGMRVQLMKAMSYVHGGAVLIYRLEIDSIKGGIQSLLDESLVKRDDWMSNKVVPFLVPGTLYPQIVGDSLLRFGWVKPAEKEFEGYTHSFVLSETGEKALASAKAWWDSLNWLQKAWLYVME